MQTLNVFEEGFSYLPLCFQYYTENSGFFIIYMAALVFVLLKGNDKCRRIFLPGAALMLLTVMNPLFPVVLDKVFDVNREYYRFFWLAPVVILVPYFFTALVQFADGRVKKVILPLLLIGFIFLSGQFAYRTGYPATENIYRVSDELIRISEIIHDHSRVEFPKAMFEYQYNMEIRQYDPSILLAIDRETYIYAMNYEITEEMMGEETIENRLLAALIRGQYVEVGAFLEALEKTNTEYIIVSKGNVMIPYIESAGLTIIGGTEGHLVYHHQMQTEHEPFKLVDYSEVW